MKTYTFKVVVEPDEDALGNPAWHAYCLALESVGAATSEEGRPLPEGPADDVEVIEVSKEAPRIAVTV